MTRNIRRLFLEPEVSVAWLVDVLSLLPSDAMVTGVFHQVERCGTTIYVVHPDFTEIDSAVNIPELQVSVEQFRSFFGKTMLRPVKLTDPATKMEFEGGKVSESK